MATIASLPGRWSYLYREPPRLDGDSTQSPGWNASIGFETDYSNLVAFVTTIIGKVQTITTPGGLSFPRVVPLQHPLYSNLWAYRVRTEAFGTPSATSTALQDQYTNVKVIVDFWNPPYPTGNSPTPYMTITVDGSSLYTTIPGRQLKFSTGEVLGQDAGQFTGQTAYNFTLYQCPNLGDDVLEGLQNTINNAPVLGRPTGQLLFNSWKADYQVLSDGSLQYTKQLAIVYQSHPWNQFYRSDGVLDTPTDPSSNPVYNAADWSAIFN